MVPQTTGSTVSVFTVLFLFIHREAWWCLLTLLAEDDIRGHGLFLQNLAMEWFGLAAAQGNPHSSYNLARIAALVRITNFVQRLP